MSMIITGSEALSYAEARDLDLHVSAGPAGTSKVSLEEAKKIAQENPERIFLEFRGWDFPTRTEYYPGDYLGYYAGDYFTGGEYLGPDTYGIEPHFE